MGPSYTPAPQTRACVFGTAAHARMAHGDWGLGFPKECGGKGPKMLGFLGLLFKAGEKGVPPKKRILLL